MPPAAPPSVPHFASRLLRHCLGALALLAVALGVVLAGSTSASAGTIDPPAPPPPTLELYLVSGPPGTAADLAADGYDVVSRRPDGDLESVHVALTGRQLLRVRSAGYLARPLLDAAGRSQLEAAAAQAAGGYRVWTPYSGRGGIADRLRTLVADHPGVAQLKVLGTSAQGRPILAVRVTGHVRDTPAGSRPAVLYTGLRDARGWVAGEVVLRLLDEAVTKKTALREAAGTNELWFVPVLNPDGYDRTFTAGRRLWATNLRGVDLAHNFATRFGEDDEGSSPDPADARYRGPAANSEPETRALDGLLRRVHFTYAVDYGAYGERLLFPSGWQSATPTADEPAYRALSGDDAAPAIPGYDVGHLADHALSNGDPRDHAHRYYGTLAWRVDLGEGCAGCAFVFPDDPAALAAEVARNHAFALDLARSAGRPATPLSHLGTNAPDLLADGFATSAGTTQPVEAVAARHLGPVTAHWRVAGGPERTAATAPPPAGERYGAGYDAVYRRLRATVTDTRPGQSVEVWFTAGTARSPSFTYRVADRIGADVLVLAAEDVTGTSPPQVAGAARYARVYADALEAAGYSADVYDVDAAGRVPPHPLGVLWHYRTVVWETGDDVVARFPGQPYGTASRLELENVLAVREYLNAGGKLLLAGAYAGFGQARNGAFYYSAGDEACRDREAARCLPLVDDFLQYWLGLGRYLDNDGDGVGGPLGLAGTPGGPLDALRVYPGTDAGRHTAGFASTAGLADSSERASTTPLRWDDGTPDPLAPATGLGFAWTGRAAHDYRRLTRTIDLTGHASAALAFRASYGLTSGWDHLFVEARTPGGDDWTTLPVPGRTTTATGAACAADLALGATPAHPEFAAYQGADCAPAGRTGTWNAATGRSAGWEDWTVDLSRFAGRAVEISVTTATDALAPPLGVFVDDAALTVDGVTTATSFEDAAAADGTSDGWSGTWTRTGQVFSSGAALLTADTAYLGLGLESLPAAEGRAELIRSLLGLLRAAPAEPAELGAGSS